MTIRIWQIKHIESNLFIVCCMGCKQNLAGEGNAKVMKNSFSQEKGDRGKVWNDIWKGVIFHFCPSTFSWEVDSIQKEEGKTEKAEEERED